MKCKHCNGDFHDVAFYIDKVKSPGNSIDISVEKTYRRPICDLCRQTMRDEIKRENRWKIKARDTRDRHAKRLKKTIPEMEEAGWRLDRIEHRLRHDYENTCSYCEIPYAEMAHGLWDITLDIVDRNRPPYLATNVLTCCMTCNRKKHIMTPDQWESYLAYVRKWKDWKKRGDFAGTLFEGVETLFPGDPT